jgi:hypothetical protein
MLQTISEFMLCAAKQSQEFMFCAAKQSQDFLSFLLVLQNNLKIFFLSCLCCKTISRFSFFLACAANNLLVQIILEAYGCV